MNISKAFKAAAKVYFSHFSVVLKFLIVEFCLTLFCFVPMLFLFEAGLRPLALLAVPLFVLILLPARMNAAEAMRDALQGGSLFTLRLVDPSNYGRKLGYALKRAGFLIHVSGDMDGFTLMRMIRSDFGGGDLVRGVLAIAIAVLGTMLLVAFGCAFHSGARHAFAQGNPDILRGHHGKIVLIWLCALLSVLPVILAAVLAFVRYLPALSDLNGLFMNTVNLPPTRKTLEILGIGMLLTLPLLPLRSLISAAFVNGLETKG